MAEIIDLTVSPRPEIIEILSDNSPARPSRTQENKKRKRKKRKTHNRLASDSGIGSSASAQPSRAPSHSPETGNKQSGGNDSSIPQTASQAPQSVSSSTVDESGLFVIDGVPAPIVVEDTPTPEPTESKDDGNKLLLPSHVTILDDDGPIPVQVIPPTKLSSDDEDYIVYLDYEDRKAPGLVRYFEVDETNQSKPSIFKCKNCGAEGDHKAYECPIQICLTCGARDEHSTRSCPISKTCYTCGMKGHINKTCPNRFSAYMASSDFRGDCDRCGSAEHKTNECPTLWRIYQYVNDEERILIMQSREEKKQHAIGEGGEGYISREMWCYNCANTGHLGDDCDELPHSATCPTEHSAFSSHSVMSGPFYDPATEPVPVKRGPRDRESRVDWPHLADDWDASAPPVDVGKRGKDKDKEKLEKRFREQEDEDEDWFNDIRNVKRRGMDQQSPSQRPQVDLLLRRPRAVDPACLRGSAILVEEGIWGKMIVVANNMTIRISPRIPFGFEELQANKETRTVRIDGMETNRVIEDRGEAIMGHGTKVATIDDDVEVALEKANEISSQPHVFQLQLETLVHALNYRSPRPSKTLLTSRITMLSALVASPTLDLGVRSRASSKPASATVDPTAPAPPASISPVTRAAISIEYASLRHDRHCPTGMYITPSAESMLVWDAVLFVHKGDYAGSVLKFVMTFPDNYPERPPTVRFVTDVFHPLVATQTGLFNLTARFRPWRPKEHHVHNVLYFVKTAFKERALDKLNEMDVVNKEAFKYVSFCMLSPLVWSSADMFVRLYTENRSSFTALAQQSSQLSQSPSALYDAPTSRKAYSFHFAPTESEQVNKVLETLSIRAPSSGHSS
ncbi:hypothetical protein V8E55_002054 [Tylopilus felleus]